MGRPMQEPMADPMADPHRSLPLARVLGIVGIAVLGVAMLWLTSDAAFGVDPAGVTLYGLRYTDPAAVRERLNMAQDVRPATLVISTRSMEESLETLPTVASARVRAAMPNDLTVTLTEREPILAWRIGEGGQGDQAGQPGTDGWLVDVQGAAFAPISLATDEELGDGSTGSALPSVADLRAQPLHALGDRLDRSDIDAVRTLGNVTPELVDSSASALFLSLDDTHGWILTSPGHWQAVFGHYSDTLAPTNRIPYQVQCLAALLKDHETIVDGVWLALGTDYCGTFVSGTPEPIPHTKRTPRPGTTHRPGGTPRP